MNSAFILQSVEGIISASKEDLVLCPGLGPQKVSLDINLYILKTQKVEGAYPK